MLERIKSLLQKIDDVRSLRSPAERGVSQVSDVCLSAMFAERDLLEAEIRSAFESFSTIAARERELSPPCILNRLKAMPLGDLEQMCQLAYQNGYRGVDDSVLLETLEGCGLFIDAPSELHSGNARKDLAWFREKVDLWLWAQGVSTHAKGGDRQG